ncbi:MAG: hypothetical protein SPH44_05425 [Eubacteriales bacterium]|nr:hypothetical protein [Eubacteriales bacterium]
MFVGNSITRHEVKTDIGLHNDWGMAVSALENGYVHIIAELILQKDCDEAFLYMSDCRMGKKLLQWWDNI